MLVKKKAIAAWWSITMPRIAAMHQHSNYPYVRIVLLERLTMASTEPATPLLSLPGHSRAAAAHCDRAEQSSGLLVDTVDLPPLNVREMRASWQMLQQHVSELPDAESLAALFGHLEQVVARNATTDEEIAAVLIREELWLQSEVFSRVAVPRRSSQSNRGSLPFDSQVDSQRCGRWWTRGWMCGVRFVIRKQSQIQADGTGSPKSALQA
jgi:hypothetical protein